MWDQAADLPQLLSDGITLYVPGVGQWNGTSGVYALADGLGSVRQLSDASGNIVQSYTYAPFGELLAAQGTRSPSSAPPGPWPGHTALHAVGASVASALRYTGEQTDIDTGLALCVGAHDSCTLRCILNPLFHPQRRTVLQRFVV